MSDVVYQRLRHMHLVNRPVGKSGTSCQDTWVNASSPDFTKLSTRRRMSLITRRALTAQYLNAR